MANMSKTKVPMPEQNPQVRNKNFYEVTTGYTSEMAIEEANRCIQCKTKPCIGGCPVEVKIPEFINLIAKGEFHSAYEKIMETNALPAICGRVCPQETQCEQLCVRGIKNEPVAIGRLERFCADFAMNDENYSYKNICLPPNKKRVAVIGSGPAGLTCASDLADRGYEVVIFEALHLCGGVLVYGIPEFRLPKKLVKKEIAGLERKGVKFVNGMVIGRVLSLDELLTQENFDAAFVGTGAGLPTFMNIPGENYNGVYSANEFLTRVNLMRAFEWPYSDTPVKVGEKAAIVGGGNVAMDAARSAKRLGAKEVYIIYRRSEKELPARLEEIHHAMDEGIIFKFLTNPTAIIGDDKGWVKGIECVEMELGEPDEKGRRRPIVKKGSEHIIDIDTVVMSIGNKPNPLIIKTTEGLESNKWGCIVANEKTGETSKPGIYAGGDTVTGAATVILAMGAGKNAAASIDEYIKSK